LRFYENFLPKKMLLFSPLSMDKFTEIVGKLLEFNKGIWVAASVDSSNCALVMYTKEVK
jgi:hypothetical protein